MAKIVRFTRDRSNTSRRTNSVDVECLYETSYLNDGSHCIVLKTFNPNSLTGGISQVIHLTKDKAIELIKILENEFKL